MPTSANALVWLSGFNFDWSQRAVDVVNEQALEEHIQKNTIVNPPFWVIPWQASAAEITQDQALEEPIVNPPFWMIPWQASATEIFEDQALEESANPLEAFAII